MSLDLILIGGGGHCKSCIDVIEQEGKFHIAGIVDLPLNLGNKVFKYDINACDEDIPSLVNEYTNFFVTIGFITEPNLRVTRYNLLKKLGSVFPVIVSPRAYISPYAEIGEGTIVMHDAIINANTHIGKNCIINSKALVEHDVSIGDHCHISTGSVVNGGVKIKEETFLGSNSVIKENLEIGRNSVIGCGLRLLKSLPDFSHKNQSD
jgi:sugar O-acyltransferase (sialic acid O-acetyltransferase NeuD family)